MSFKIVNRYEEGDAYTFPLESGGFGACIVTRFEPDRRYGSKLVMLAGFGTQFSSMPSLDDVSNFRLTDVVCYSMYRDRRLVDGTWTRLGIMPRYSRQRWPLPLWRSYLLGGVVEYDSDQLSESDTLALPGEIEPHEYPMFLRGRGCGTEDGMPCHLDRIFKNPDHFQRDRITPRKIRFWADYRERLRAAGRYPPSIINRASPKRPIKRIPSANKAELPSRAKK